MMTPLQVLRDTYQRTANDTFSDELARDLLAVLADLSARLSVLEEKARGEAE